MGIICRKYNIQKFEEWNDFLYRSKTPMFLFDRNYMEYHQDRFEDFSLMFYSDNKLVGILPGNLSDNTLESHGGLTYGGFILDKNAKQHTVSKCFDSLLSCLKRCKIQNIIYKTIPHIYHLQAAEEDKYELYRRNANLTAVAASSTINLDDPLKMPKGRKSQISRAKREGVVVRESLEKDEYKAFIDIENRILESKHGVRAVHTAEELFLLHSRFPNQIKLISAFYNDELIAGTVIYIYDKAIHTQYMAANDVARAIGGLDYVIYTVIDRYKNEKKWLDFGISTENEGKYLNEGLIAQKEGFGGRTTVCEKWELII